MAPVSTENIELTRGDTIFCFAKTATSPGQVGMGVPWVFLREPTERFAANRRFPYNRQIEQFD